MDEQILKKDFASSKEAFAALSEAERQHCERVGEYVRVLFLQACAAELYSEDEKAQVRLKEEYADLIKDMGLFHDIGKATVPPAYRQDNPDFTPEETALFRSHALTSADLAQKLLKAEKNYNHIELRLLYSGIASHHERWDGTGYPESLPGKETDLLARLLSAADALDNESARIHSEHPFEEAVQLLSDRSGTLFDPSVIKLIKTSKQKLKKVFLTYISQTRAIPETDTLVRRTASRPFLLEYRPLVRRKDSAPLAYETRLMFRVKGELKEYSEVSYLVERAKIKNDLASYMTLEACDTVKRLDTCEIPADYIIIDPPAGWLNKRGAWHDVADAAADTLTDPKRICVNIDKEVWDTRSKTVTENLSRLSKAGIQIMYTGIADIPEEELFCTKYRITSDMEDLLDSEDFASLLADYKKRGIALVADSIDKQRRQSTLTKLGILEKTGPLCGDYIQENALVTRELAAKEA